MIHCMQLSHFHFRKRKFKKKKISKIDYENKSYSFNILYNIIFIVQYVNYGGNNN